MSAKSSSKSKKKTAKTAKKKSDKQSLNLNLAVLNTQGKKVGDLDVDAKVFDGRVNMSLMHQAVVIYLANQRKGLAK